MTAIPLLHNEGRSDARDPVLEITAQIERARARQRHAKRGQPYSGGPGRTYPLFEGDTLVGAIRAPNGTPAFGPAATERRTVTVRLTCVVTCSPVFR